MEYFEKTGSSLALELYRERFQIAFKVAKICVFEVDLIRQLYTFFENAEAIFDVPGEVILHEVQSYSKLSPQVYRSAIAAYFAHPDDIKAAEEAFQRVLTGKAATYHARMRAGRSKFTWCKVDMTPIMENGRAVRMIGVITDIQELKDRNLKLELASNLDSFTGLYNKKHTLVLIQKILEQNPEKRHALVLIDIDNFKQVNDRYGHSQGDRVLLQIANNLKQNVRKTDILGRFGGDEFILFLQDIPNAEILPIKLHPFLHYYCDALQGSNSIGISIFPEDSTNVDELFEQADRALYHSKLKKGAYTLFSSLKT